MRKKPLFRAWPSVPFGCMTAAPEQARRPAPIAPRLYGCHNRPRPIAGAILTGSPAYGSQTWPFVNSTDCKHDKKQTDPGCQGCKWAEAPK